MNKFLTILISLFLLMSCQDTVDKLKRVGKAPQFENIELPTVEEDEEEIERREAKLRAQHAHMRRTNSLWQPGSTKFFRDSRAWKVGHLSDLFAIVSMKIKLFCRNTGISNSTISIL